jgi:hypothetical protein
MGVRVDVLPREDEHGPAVMLTRPGAPTSTRLEYEAQLAGGVRLRVDLARPADWRRVWVGSWTPTVLPLVRLLVGDRAVQDLGAIVDQSESKELAVDSTSASPWVRLAVVHGLDRWLQLPLEQDLVHAETGIATWRAARALPAGNEIRETLIDEALTWARRASAGAARILDGLGVSAHPVPPALRRAIDRLVEGYVALRALVSEPDARLSDVIEMGNAFRRVSAHDDHHRDEADHEPLPDPVPNRVHRAASLIDPRHVRARVLRLGDEPQAAEIALSRTKADGEDAVRVQVPAFERKVDPEIAQRLMARLVDRNSGQAHSFAALTVRTGTRTLSRPSLFECTIPLRGSDLKDLRADVFDALFRPRGAVDGTDDELVRVREAVLALRESRSLAAHAHLRGENATAFTGPGDPLVAELVAAYQSQAA